MAPAAHSQRPQVRPIVSSCREYRFEPRDPVEVVKQAAAQCSLATCFFFQPVASTPEQVVARQALRERFLIGQVTDPTKYSARLTDQARGASVPEKRTIPNVLAPNESKQEDDTKLMSWVQRVWRLPSLLSLRDSYAEVDVRLELKLRSTLRS